MNEQFVQYLSFSSRGRIEYLQFIIDLGYVYMLRCAPVRGDDNFYAYCYRRQAFEKARTQLKQKERPAPKRKRAEPER